jgi:hypothetical protein
MINLQNFRDIAALSSEQAAILQQAQKTLSLAQAHHEWAEAVVKAQLTGLVTGAATTAAARSLSSSGNHPNRSRPNQ